MTGDMYSYFSKLFSVDQHWNLEHIVLTVAFFVSKGGIFSKGCIYGLKRNGGLGRLFIFVHSVCPFSCIVFCFVRKKLFCSSKKLYCVSLTLYCIVLLKLLYNLVCKFANIKYKSYSYKCLKFFFKKCCVCTSVYWCTSISPICGDNMIESDEPSAKFEVFTIGGLLAD